MNTHEIFQEAFEWYRKGDFEQAQNICGELLKAEPDNAEAAHLLGLISYKLGNYGGALKNIRKALRLDPQNADAHFDLGNVLHEDGKIAKAITSYRKAIKLNPHYAEAYNNLGIALQDNMQLDKALKSYKEALNVDPDYAEAYNNLGVVFQEKKQLDEAITHFQKALLLQSAYANAYHNLVDAVQGKGYDAINIFQTNTIYAIYRCFNGEDYIQESIKSISDKVDKIFVFSDDTPLGNAAECLYKGQRIPFPKQIDGVVEKIKELDNPKIELLYDHQDTNDNHLTHFLNDIILPKYEKPSIVLYMEVDHVFRNDQLKSAIDEFILQDYVFATAGQIDIWKNMHYRLPERNDKVGAVFCNLSKLRKMPITLKHGGIAVMPRLDACVHSFSFAVSEKAMYWKHLLSIAFSQKFGGSAPYEDWYEEKWLKWDYETNNENLDISEQYKIPSAIPYNTDELPELIRNKYSL
jgi:tetratricopeptide (TPR) repeat protein